MIYVIQKTCVQNFLPYHISSHMEVELEINFHMNFQGSASILLSRSEYNLLLNISSFLFNFIYFSSFKIKFLLNRILGNNCDNYNYSPSMAIIQVHNPTNPNKRNLHNGC